ncbi:hypothetical protein ColTof4_11652 [Colletotrichum tofieldiae]|nr:hypothetical protein ColTof3_03275 [Colletotrichum tofieldiae]GKT79229.1 hypothetical protein ColTof4_11652 [Colletotrichum tofieldiae]GKT82394.1 hypothetical protein Ct61P_00244 [Colletotrichum tofieldiae]
MALSSSYIATESSHFVPGRETKAQISLDVPVANLKVGPQGSWNPGPLSKHTTTVNGPIVFAFQVSRLRARIKGKARTK